MEKEIMELGKRTKQLRDQLRTDPDMRIRFFRWIGKSNVAKYSLSNALLIFYQRPNITFVASRRYWEKNGLSVTEDTASIKILKPTKEEGRYEIAELFDAEDVGAVATPPEPSYKRLGYWLWKISNLPTITTSEHLVLTSILSYMGLTVEVEDEEKNDLDMEAITEAYKAVRDIFFGSYNPFQEILKMLKHLSEDQLEKLVHTIKFETIASKEE